MEVIDVEIDLRTSSGKVSEKAPFRARNCKEICKFQLLSPNEDNLFALIILTSNRAIEARNKNE